MLGTMPGQRYCGFEKTMFPEDQFRFYKEYGLVHEHPPDEAVPKHTVSGQILPDEPGAVKTWSVPSSARQKT
jgi:hypothetical protein